VVLELRSSLVHLDDQSDQLFQHDLGILVFLGILGDRPNLGHLEILAYQQDLGNQLVQSALNTGTYQQNAPYASALNLQNILQKSKLPEDEVKTTDLGLLNQLAGLGTMFSGGLDALNDRVVTNSAGQKVTVPGLLSQLGIKGGLSGLVSAAGDLLSGPPDYTGTEIENPALPGHEGYGWQYFDTGDGNVTIDPSGNYYQNNELIWSPSWGNYGSSGGGGDTDYTGDYSEYDFEDGGYSPF
jgi:hypothetical protein